MNKKETLEVFERGDFMSLSLKERRAVIKEVSKRYDKPKAPYQRIMESDKIPWKIKEKLTEEYNELNPALLKRKLDKLQRKLSKAYDIKQREKELSPNIPNISSLTKNNLVYNFSETIK